MISLSYSISSLTPIVTGDHDHRNTELLATGILGSLRYQYWLLKAMQAWEKNPQHPVYPLCSIENLPPANSTHFKEELHKAGPVVWLFGATNWKKMFRLEIADAVQGEPQPCSARSHSNAPHQWQNVKLTFRNDRESLIFEENGTTLEHELRSLMAFVHQYGWLGAAPQNGLGWVAVEGEGLGEKISLPIDRNNPVFAAKEIELSASCVKDLLAALRDFYNPKLADAKRKLEAIEAEISLYGLNEKRKKERNWQHSRKIRYDNSLHFLDHKNSEFPVGYEIRRWLREQMFPRNIKEQEQFFGGRDHAGFVHVTHPDVQDGSWRLRLRFAVRPGEHGGINPIVSPSPAAWLDDCEKLLKSV